MDLEKQLLADLSKGNVQFVSNVILNDLNLLDKLWNIITSSPAPLPMRAAWTMQQIIEEFPELLNKYYSRLVPQIEKCPDDSTRKVLMKMIILTELKEKHINKLYDICYRYFLDAKRSLAVRAYSLEILYKISLKYPELSNEVLLLLDLITEEDAPALQAKQRLLRKSIFKNITRNEKQNHSN
ncbi:MAG: hypothetical protein A2W91_10760 [Bacteroidetes bacterium GWF2_38_335]|nr:MAG: hypothetical protein A2W91_10760 [Bacteroidetes bacterium GWF2_38_335]OFY81817.1 MAG: hypothetical protein A2281_06280 [Bacteroidetes bacterium RIFOXYA12_FULL_38_20]HBS87890.1 hypothetical protein [Bacteroidales bacterium]